ncbi:uncharacterized protein [Rutidosis leptorrhynchoides]|uniref:uncharacterized protein n=1 Tax=Rutidosis leptorrhynchoides TaxID=125765 RepID=UPI003A9A1B4D
MTTSKPLPATKNPKKWRFTYESNSHVPILRLYIFNPYINPSSQCVNLNATILFDKSLLKVKWLANNHDADDDNQLASIYVPIPRVLIDVDSPINLRAFDDHIEVKFVLVLPVDHPIVYNFDFDSGQDVVASQNDEFQPLQLDSDVKKLASCGEVFFYCRGCSTKLTRPVRFFREMPSVNWREAADNWFGTCCCSFGGVSEKLVAKYANLYTCSSDVCLLDATSVVLCKDDLIGYKFPDQVDKQENKSLGLSKLKISSEVVAKNLSTDALSVDHSSQHECCHVHVDEEQTHSTDELPVNKASLLNGLLGNSFMVTSSYLSKDVIWSEISCPHCSCLLGAYPRDNIVGTSNGSPLNDSVHLFKCFVSTCLPVGGPTDLFRKYTLERMFTRQLLESAEDELSFRTVVRNLHTRSPMLQIVLLNPNSWCSFGDCMDEMVPNPNIIMYPMIKVLFSDCSNQTESQLRKLDEWVAKNQVGDIYMLMSKGLTESLKLANSMLPPSHACLQDLSLSFLRRFINGDE